jgi:hypothetical protein
MDSEVLGTSRDLLPVYSGNMYGRYRVRGWSKQLRDLRKLLSCVQRQGTLNLEVFMWSCAL